MDRNKFLKIIKPTFQIQTEEQFGLWDIWFNGVDILHKELINNVN
jgi:hypothetical protein